MNDEWLQSMAKAFYLGEGGKTMINVFLPDTIYVRDERGNKRLVEFSYTERYHVVSMSRSILEFVTMNVIASVLLRRSGAGPFEYRRSR